jgi:hypothetical protein
MLHSLESGDTLVLMFAEESVGMLSFTAGRLSCIIASGPGFSQTAPISVLREPLLDFARKATGKCDRRD